MWLQAPEGNLAYSILATQISSEVVYGILRHEEGDASRKRTMLWRDEIVIFSSDFASLLSSMPKTMQTLMELGFSPDVPQVPRQWHALHGGGLAAMKASESQYVRRSLLACYRLRVDDEYIWCNGKRRGLYKDAKVADAVTDFCTFLARAKSKGILPAWLQTSDIHKDKSLAFAWRAADWNIGPLLPLRLLADEIEGRWRMTNTP